MRPCGVEGCGAAHAARGLCNAHYQRWFSHGDTYPAIPVAHANRSLEAPLPRYTDAELDAVRERVNVRAAFLTAAVLVGMANDAMQEAAK